MQGRFLLAQNPHVGCASLHLSLSIIRLILKAEDFTLTFLVLHVVHPPLDFLWGRFVMKSPVMIACKELMELHDFELA